MSTVSVPGRWEGPRSISRAQVRSLLTRLRHAIEMDPRLAFEPLLWGLRVGLEDEDMRQLLRAYERKYNAVIG